MMFGVFGVERRRCLMFSKFFGGEEMNFMILRE